MCSPITLKSGNLARKSAIEVFISLRLLSNSAGNSVSEMFFSFVSFFVAPFRGGGGGAKTRKRHHDPRRPVLLRVCRCMGHESNFHTLSTKWSCPPHSHPWSLGELKWSLLCGPSSGIHSSSIHDLKKLL